MSVFIAIARRARRPPFEAAISALARTRRTALGAGFRSSGTTRTAIAWRAVRSAGTTPRRTHFSNSHHQPLEFVSAELVVIVLIEFLEEPHRRQRPAKSARSPTIKTWSDWRKPVRVAAAFCSTRWARSAARAVASLTPRAPFVTVFSAIFARFGALLVV
jgi:hypothetical protein